MILDARVNIDNIERCQDQIQTAVYIERILNKVQSWVQRDDHMSIDDQDAGAADDTEHEEDDEETLELVSLDEVLYNTESC